MSSRWADRGRPLARENDDAKLGEEGTEDRGWGTGGGQGKERRAKTGGSEAGACGQQSGQFSWPGANESGGAAESEPRRNVDALAPNNRRDRVDALALSAEAEVDERALGIRCRGESLVAHDAESRRYGRGRVRRSNDGRAIDSERGSKRREENFRRRDNSRKTAKKEKGREGKEKDGARISREKGEG